jgi:hypothetical protein
MPAILYLSTAFSFDLGIRPVFDPGGAAEREEYVF